jgi:hypothetical protein
MEVLEIYPKDWFVRIELSLDQIQKILDFLDNCTFEGSSESRDLVAAKDYVVGDFFAKLDALSEDIIRRRGI